MPPPNYWPITNNPYLTPSTYYGYHNPQPNDFPLEKEPATPTSVPETQLSERETLIDLEHLDNVDVGGEGKKKRSNWSKAEDEVLARSFVTISDDPIIDNEQKADAFCGRVASYAGLWEKSAFERRTSIHRVFLAKRQRLVKICFGRAMERSDRHCTGRMRRHEERSAGARRPAGELSNDDVSSNVSNQQEVTAQTSSWYLKLAIAKRCRLNKSIRQRFASALKIQQMACAMIKTSR
ncbi:hypothetical protein F511_01269 [Dorcoceras hygrometricum]|uniref:Myb-like domain-containing protein n=1 Tax=Dorcoceras hygrometricum TaxID=472368 RepID=A0A2Z7BS33_9LAMI|nr:hypothetical protein F511_01269 [Dorcoceras hygrometricum]